MGICFTVLLLLCYCVLLRITVIVTVTVTVLLCAVQQLTNCFFQLVISGDNVSSQTFQVMLELAHVRSISHDIDSMYPFSFGHLNDQLQDATEVLCSMYNKDVVGSNQGCDREQLRTSRQSPTAADTVSEQTRKEKTMPVGVNVMRSQVFSQAAQGVGQLCTLKGNYSTGIDRDWSLHFSRGRQAPHFKEYAFCPTCTRVCCNATCMDAHLPDRTIGTVLDYNISCLHIDKFLKHAQCCWRAGKQQKASQVSNDICSVHCVLATYLMDIVAAAATGMSSGMTCIAAASKTADCLQVPAPASRGTTREPLRKVTCSKIALSAMSAHTSLLTIFQDSAALRRAPIK